VAEVLLCRNAKGQEVVPVARIITWTLALVLTTGLAACTQSEADANSERTLFKKLAPVGATRPEAPKKLIVPEGTRLRIALIDGVSTTKSSPGDEFLATLLEPVVTVDGTTVFERGATVRGRVTDVNESSRVRGRASIRLVLTSIAWKGKDVAISSRAFVAVAQNSKKREAENSGKSAPAGATVGAGAGNGSVLAAKGKNIYYPPETKMSFSLAESITL
jgi:hypothetical protein